MSNFFANPAVAAAEAASPPKQKPQPAPEQTAAQPAPPVVSPTPALDAVTAQPTRPVNAPAATPPAKPKLQPVTGPPVPALAAQGWYGSIHDFNDRVQAVTDTYHTATGAAPKPAYVLAMAKSPVPTEQLRRKVISDLSSSFGSTSGNVFGHTTAGPQPAGMVAPGNVNLDARPTVHNPDGSISTVRSITVTGDDGRATLIPTVVNGRVVSDEQATAYWRRTGQNLGTFVNEKAADAYAERLHGSQAAEYLPLDHIDAQDTGKLLEALKGNAAAGGYDQFMQRHGQQIQALLSDPATKAAATAALAAAKQTDAFQNKQEAGPGTAATLENIAMAPVKAIEAAPHAAAFIGKTGYAADQDVGQLAHAVETGNLKQAKQAATLPNLTATAPAVAQVVKGLVYSPVGVARAAVALHEDLAAADPTNPRHFGESDLSFKHSRAIAVETVQQTLDDLAHPNGRWGYLFLDGLAVASLGGGTVARLGRFGEVAADEGVVAGAKAAMRPHPLQTATLSKDGFEAQIKLAQTPLMRMAQERWIDLAQHHLDRPPAENTDLFGNPLDGLLPEGSYPAKVAQWASRNNPLSPERMIGRAENLRLTTEARALSGLSTLLNDVAGSAARRSRWEQLIPDNIFKGLTPGEMKALELSSYDIRQGLSPVTTAERNAQFAIENGIGDTDAWNHQLAMTALARKALEDPSPRFQAAVHAVQAATAQMEAIKADAEWLTDETMENRVVKAGALVEHFPELAPQIEAHLAAKAALQRAEGFARKQPGSTDALAVGARVRPADRGNLGRITAIHGDTAEVHFVNRTDGTQETKTFPVSELSTELEAARADVAAHPHPFVDMEDGGVGMRVGDTVVPLNRNRPDSWYFPHALKAKAQKRPTLTFARTSPYGLSPAMLPSELRHEMTGAAYIHGDYRLDIHHLAGERLAKTARAFVQWQQWQRAWDNAAVDHQPGYVAVRDVRNVPDDLRRALGRFLDEHIDLDSVDSLPDDVSRHLFPKDNEIEAGEHVRWIDPRLLGNTSSSFRGDHFRAFEKVNNVLRPLIFYLTPKYAMNAVGNAGMLALDQGFVRGYANLVRAMRIEQDSVGDDAALIKDHVGGGRSEAYALGTSQKVNRALADFWNHLTDEKFRVASFLHYADVKGYRTAAARHVLLTDSAAAADLVDVTRRANEALVAFDRMSPFERAWLRHLIFVYPWQRGAFLWSFRTIFEHPAKTALLATLGQDAYNDETWLKESAAWVRRTGYLPLNWAASKAEGQLPEGLQGMLHVYSPQNVNTFSTLGDLSQVVKAEVSGDQYAAVGDLLGPPGQMAVHAALGVDEYGNRYTGSQLMGALKGALGTIPYVALLDAKQRKANKPLPALDIANRRSLISRYHGYLAQAATSPGALDGFGRLLWGADAELNLPAVEERYWRDASPKARHAREVKLIQDWTTAQGQYLGRPVPKQVRAAINDQAQYTWAVKQWLAKQQKTDATPKERLDLLIGYYHDAGRVTAQQAGKLRKAADALEDVRAIKTMQGQLAVRYGNAGALATWGRDVRMAAGVVKNLDVYTGQLFGLGLADQRVYRLAGPSEDVGGLGALNVSKAKLDYARGYTAYIDGREKVQAEIKAGKATAADLAMFDDDHDKPVGKLPSYSRLRMAVAPRDPQAYVQHLATKPWASLSGVEKAALGRKVSPDMSAAWADLKIGEKQVRAAGGSVNAAERLAIAKVLNKKDYYPGFLQDYLYSRMSRAERFERSPLYQQIPDADQATISEIFLSSAQLLRKAIDENGGQARYLDYWRGWLAKSIDPWLKSDPDGRRIARELAPYGRDFLEGLPLAG